MFGGAKQRLQQTLPTSATQPAITRCLKTLKTNSYQAHPLITCFCFMTAFCHTQHKLAQIQAVNLSSRLQ